jgi:hypothetical protein
MVDCPLYNILAWQMKFFNLSTVKKKKEKTEIIRYQTRVTQQEFAIIKTQRHNRMSPPNLPYNDINLIYIDYKSNDSLPPKYTTFHHLIYVSRWSPTLIYF